MTTSLEQPQSSTRNEDYPVLSTRDKIINAIPLVLVFVAVAYFAYSCQQNKNLTNVTAQFIQTYQLVNADFDQELEKCLHKQLAEQDFKKNLVRIHLPRLRGLYQQSKTLPNETTSFIIAYPQVLKVLELKIQLAEGILEEDESKQGKPIIKILQQINILQKAINEKTEAVNTNQATD